MKKYQEIDNTCYDVKTSKEVINVLENVRNDNSRIRIWLGENGKSWNEENDIMGYIGRSTGIYPIPLLIHNSRSFGGGALLDHCIVKIVNTSTGKVLYQHKDFKQGKFTVKGNKVFMNDKSYAPYCENKDQAQRLCDFMNGKRNCK